MTPKIILLVEDNPSDIELTRRIISKSKISNQMIVKEDGQEALDYLLHSDHDSNPLPDLILLDLKLPRVHGLEVLRQLRANSHTRYLPVVILSTSIEEQDMIQGYELYANSYIRKPVDYVQFSQILMLILQYWLETNESPRLG